MKNKKESESYGIIMALIEQGNEKTTKENYFLFFMSFLYSLPRDFLFLRKQTCIIRWMNHTKIETHLYVVH